MNQKKSSSCLVRFVGLVVVLGMLCGILTWQWRNGGWNEVLKDLTPSIRLSRQLPATPRAEELEKLQTIQLQKIQRNQSQVRAALKSAAARRYPPLSVPDMPAAMTRSQIREKTVQYRMRELSDYRRLTQDSPEARSASEKFLEMYLRDIVEREVRVIDYQKLERLGREALDAGSKDPLLRTYHARALWSSAGDWEAVKTWTEVLSEFEKSNYPRNVALNAWIFRRAAAGTRPDPELNEFRSLPVQMLVKWLQEEGPKSGFTECLSVRVAELWDTAKPEEKEALIIGMLQSESIDEYIVNEFLGYYFTQLAFQHRGGGYANQLTMDQHLQFRLHSDCATTYLKYAWSLRPDLPFAPGRMIKFGMNFPDANESAHFWFLRTIEAQFDHYGSYKEMLHSLIPIWGGSHAQMLTFARNCVETNRFDTNVPYMIVDVLQRLQNDEKVDLRKRSDVVKLLQDFAKLRNTYRTDHADSKLYEDLTTVKTDLAMLMETCQLQDLAAAEIRSAWPRINWTRLRQNLRPGRILALRTMASQGKSGREIIAFDERLRRVWDAKSDFDQLKNLSEEYEKLKSHVGADDPAAEYFLHAGMVLDQLRQFASGDWIEMKTGPQLAGWEPYCDSWLVGDDGIVTLSMNRGGESQRLSLRPLANLHPPLEIDVTVEPGGCPAGAGIRWACEAPFELGKVEGYPAFFISSVRSSAGSDNLDFRGTSRRFGARPLETRGPHQLQLKIWDELFELVTDGGMLMTSSLLKPWDRSGFLSFGMGSEIRADDGELRLSRIRIRALKLQPAPDEKSPFEDRVRYWEGRQIGSDGEDLFTLVQLCRIRFDQGRYDEVISIADRLLEKNPHIRDVKVWKARTVLNTTHDDAAVLALIKNTSLGSPDDYEHDMALMIEILAMSEDDGIRNGQQAKTLAGIMARRKGNKYPRTHAALAAASAETGDFDAAVEAIQKAMESGNEKEKIEWEARLNAYRDKKTIRFPGKSAGPASDKSE